MAARDSFTTEEVIEAVFQDDMSDLDEISDEDSTDSEQIGDLDQLQSDSSGTEEFAETIPQPRVRPRGRRNNNSSADYVFNWQFYDDFDPFESEWLPEYNRRRGILVDTHNFKPVDFFSLFFPEEAFDLIAEETNRYAGQYFDNPADLPRASRLISWYDTCPEEIKAFVALQIATGLCQKPSLRDYWENFWLTKTSFGKVMPRNRFEQLKTFLHFNDISNQVERGEEGYNILFKIQPLLDITDPTYENVYKPKKNLCIDESMVKFKGRLSFRQYLPAKPTRWGIKEFVLSESCSGYALKAKIYTGKNSFLREKNVSLTEQVVTTLLDGYEGKGHVVYMDNFYSSPSLFQKLEVKGIGACGTVQLNRKGMPPELSVKNLKLKKGDEAVFMRDNNLVACTWQDTKRVSFLSTVHTNNTVDKRIKAKDTPGGYRTVSKPVIAQVYNENMGGVDRLDQMLGTYQYPHKSTKWYYPLYHRVREVALVNGYIIYKKASENNKLDGKAFRQEVINGLLESWNPPTVKRGRPSNLPTPQRMTGRHFLGKYENKKYKPDCAVCSDRKQGKRCQTSFYCKECDTPMCPVTCFERYHTLRDYKI